MIEVSTALVTVTVVVADIPACVAVIVAVPAATPVTRPWLPTALLTVASAAEEDAQVTDVVRSLLVPSEKVPVAVNCRLVSLVMDGFTGVIVSDFKVATTSSEADAVTGPSAVTNVAEMVEVPESRPSPCPPGLIVATVGFDEVQVTRVVRSPVVPLLKVPFAVNC